MSNWLIQRTQYAVNFHSIFYIVTDFIWLLVTQEYNKVIFTGLFYFIADQLWIEKMWYSTFALIHDIGELNS